MHKALSLSFPHASMLSVLDCFIKGDL
uniref:Uncharacterized protein n=1 Tax=Anguilla anguilla TaxID=7936 RepID=A0A0E9R8M2_ANGAN